MTFGSYRKTVGVVAGLALLVFADCQTRTDQDHLGSGLIESRIYRVATTVEGPLVTVGRSEGEEAARGELVAVVDTTPFILALQEIQAHQAELAKIIASRNAQVSSLEEEMRGLAREYGRIGELADKGSVPMQQKDDLGTRMKAADYRLQSEKQMLASLVEKKRAVGVQVQQAKDRLARCYLHAPGGGIVVSRFRNPGEVVESGTTVMEIGSRDTLYVDFSVTRTGLARLGFGQTVYLQLLGGGRKGDGNGKRIPATIIRMGTREAFGEASTARFSVRARIANPPPTLTRGLPVDVWL